MVKNNFKKELQGLRALAVLSVVVFHIFPRYLPGGFIGVDIFFVISGYLIMGKIWAGLADGSFSFADFYARRIVRLFPAFFVVVVVSSLLGWWLLLPAEFSAFSKSAVAALLYVSNFWFYLETDYFNQALDSAPLLHVWSLSVEEQFYLLTPLALFWLYRKKGIAVPLLVGLAAVSLLLSEWLLSFDRSLCFYASPSRFWQFLVGGLLAICAPELESAASRMDQFLRNKRLRRFLREVLCLALLLVLVGFMLRGSYGDFPGFKALIPTLATALLILCLKPAEYVWNLVANPLAVWVGNMSYSLYLWHWPVIIFYKEGVYHHLTAFHGIAVFGLCLLIGFLSYVFVEEPFRRGRLSFCADGKPGARLARLLWCSGVGSLALGILVVLAATQNSLSPQQALYEQHLNNITNNFRWNQCFLTSYSKGFAAFDRDECLPFDPQKDNILLLGDSHAAQWYQAMNDHLDATQTLNQATASGCKPTLDASGEGQCLDLMSWVFGSLIQEFEFDTVIIAARWSEKDVEALDKTLDLLQSEGLTVVVFGPVLEYDLALPKVLIRNGADGAWRYNRYQAIQVIDHQLAEMVEGKQVRYVSVLEAACASPNDCETLVEGIPLQFDYGHLTYDGAAYLLERMAVFPGQSN